MTPQRVAVIGAGSWGTALAALLAGNGQRVRLWAFEDEVVRSVRERRENLLYLPGIPLPADLEVTPELAEALEAAEVVVSVSPAQFVHGVMRRAAPHVPDGALVVSATKGIDLTTRRRMDEVLTDAFGASLADRLVVLSGPSFAVEVARGEPTAVVLASARPEASLRAQGLFQSATFRTYTSSDVIGVELGGALKNVIALAAGVGAGLGLGENARAALLTRGLAEMTRLGVRFGARASTFAGLAGLGDLVLTCTGETSRNRTVGYRLGRGEPLARILGDMHAVAEGVKTAEAVKDLARSVDVEMPITEEVCRILLEGKPPAEALRSLLAREPRSEEMD